jgi:hypothetical protein
MTQENKTIFLKDKKRNRSINALYLRVDMNNFPAGINHFHETR